MQLPPHNHRLLYLINSTLTHELKTICTQLRIEVAGRHMEKLERMSIFPQYFSLPETNEANKRAPNPTQQHERRAKEPPCTATNANTSKLPARFVDQTSMTVLESAT